MQDIQKEEENAEIMKIIYTSYETISKQKIKGSNKKKLWGLKAKKKCYIDSKGEPLAYYQCFDRVEQNLMNFHNKFVHSAQIYDDQFKVCWSECEEAIKNNASFEAINKCKKKCGNQYNKIMSLLYDKYYSDFPYL